MSASAAPTSNVVSPSSIAPEPTDHRRRRTRIPGAHLADLRLQQVLEAVDAVAVEESHPVTNGFSSVIVRAVKP
jgi:hypothetical protein